ncbi:class D beta-lactamase [Flavisolibacter nicotianae]|uniref:class D beta-lactamase n=1 Tax=Flavisolibacter nicotianae TaxID=2364882 RepID=UPI000EABEA66|nr:class D beta-lactamase [Flavisolibacter nicotianae]
MRFFLFLIVAFSFAACTSNNVTTDNSLKKYFDEQKAEGCFGLFNNGNGQFTIYNLPRYRDSAFLPASTFKIVNALVGLQTGKITNDSMIIKWDGVTRDNPEWNQDLSMYRAFRVSAVPYFQEVARRIGRDTLQHWVDSIAYGTKKIKGPVDSFWLNNTLKITPDEEMGLVKRLYFNQLPFFTPYQEVVKKAMLFEDKPTYRLSYKTGLGRKEDGTPLAWVVGWIEENRHPYFFVLNMESKDSTADLLNGRMTALRGILKQLGFFEGQR